MSDEIKWLVGIAIAALSFLLGGGTVRQWYKRADRLIDIDDLSKTFVQVRDFEAFCREDALWRTRLMEDYVKPHQEFAKTLAAVTTAVAVQTETLRHLDKTVQELASAVHERRARQRDTDPPVD